MRPAANILYISKKSLDFLLFLWYNIYVPKGKRIFQIPLTLENIFSKSLDKLLSLWYNKYIKRERHSLKRERHTLWQRTL